MDKSFQFNVPLTLKRSEDGRMRVSGIAATEDKDLQGEVIKMTGLDITDLQRGRGVFNDDHGKGAENIIGLIDKAEILENNSLYVEGDLLDGNPKAENYFRIMEHCAKNNKESRVQMSVEGKILRRAGQDGKVIAKAKIDKVALTLDPVNRNTYAQLLKSLTSSDVQDSSQEDTTGTDGESSSASSVSSGFISKEDLESAVFEGVKKALAMNGSYADTLPQNMTGGTAMSKESLDAKKKKAKKVIKSVLDKYPNVDKSLLTKVIVKKLMQTKEQ